MEEKDKTLPPNPFRILFVDDEKSIVDSVEYFLKHLGYKIYATTSSMDALKAFKTEPAEYNIIFTDLNMPEMTGLKLAKEIRKLCSHIPIILCSGSIEDIRTIKTGTDGINEIITKPYKLRTDLVDIIKKYLT